MRLLPRTRNLLATPLLLAGCLLAIVSVPVFWLHRTALDTNNYVETVAPLSDDPAIKNAMADFITGQVFQMVDPEEIARSVLPPQAQVGATALTGMARGVIYEEVRQQLDAPQFSGLWREANRGAHASVMKILLADGPAPRDPTISLDINPFWGMLSNSLQQKGIFIPGMDSLGGDFNLFRLRGVNQARVAIRIFNQVASWLPIVSIAAIVGGLVVSSNRRRAFMWILLVFAAGMLGLLAVIILGRGVYLQGIDMAGDIDLAAATSFYNIMIDSLRNMLAGFLFGALVLAAASFLLGRR
jgi:hypothetical protein